MDAVLAITLMCFEIISSNSLIHGPDVHKLKNDRTLSVLGNDGFGVV